MRKKYNIEEGDGPKTQMLLRKHGSVLQKPNTTMDIASKCTSEQEHIEQVMTFLLVNCDSAVKVEILKEKLQNALNRSADILNEINTRISQLDKSSKEYQDLLDTKYKYISMLTWTFVHANTLFNIDRNLNLKDPREPQQPGLQIEFPPSPITQIVADVTIMQRIGEDIVNKMCGLENLPPLYDAKWLMKGREEQKMNENAFAPYNVLIDPLRNNAFGKMNSHLSKFDQFIVTGISDFIKAIKRIS